jgi:DNA-binding LytR/AlgR family response regulator
MLRGREQRHAEHREPEKQDESFIFIKSSKKTFKVNLNDILYIEALGDYVKIFTTEKMIISYQSLKNIETLLPAPSFPRIHKSFIIALSRIDMIEGNHVKIKDRMIPIGTNFKAEFEKLIKSI